MKRPLEERNRNAINLDIDKGWKTFFPYIKIRPLQEQIIDTLYRYYSWGNHSIIQAANGVGKTVAVLTALIPKALENDKHIIYCCRTHQQQSRVIEELKMIKQLKDIAAVSLKGRQELCLHRIVTKFAVDSSNAAEICNYLKKEGKCKYFVNFGKKAVQKKIDTIFGNKVLDSDELLKIGRDLEVCPFEISKRLIPSSNVIVVNYQHVFNPHISKVLLSNLERDLSDVVLIIDEAHNLPSVAIDISSSSLSYSTVDHAVDEAEKLYEKDIAKTLKSILKAIKFYAKKLSLDEETQINPNNFLKKAEEKVNQKIDERFLEKLEEIGDIIKTNQLAKNKTPYSYCSSVARYFGQLLNTKDRIDFAHFIAISATKIRDAQPKLVSLCLDPSFTTKEIFEQVYFSVSLSGTLDPIDAYMKLVGIDESRVNILSLPSPYHKENILTLVVTKVSSKLDHRTPEVFSSMLEVIKGTIDATPKNVGIFCASYAIMTSLLNHGLEDISSKPLFVAYQDLNSKETDELIKQFKIEAKKSGGVLVSVLGGRSSEGSDYPAEEMESVIIVGIPYAPPTPSIKATIEYLEARFPKKGREFGYHIPALTRASQAAGRPIRSLNDYAAIVLLDKRYANYYYRKFLPVWLKENMKVIEPNYELVKKKVEEFFEYHRG